MDIPFISTKIYEAHYPVNCFFQLEAWNGRPALIGTPGLLEWGDPSYQKEVRGFKKLNEFTAYQVIGSHVYKINTSADYTLCIGTLATSSGPVQMEGNGTYMVIVDFAQGYYVLDTIVTRIVDPDFPIPSGLTFQDGYWIVTKENSGRFYISPANDPSGNWSGLDFTTAEGLPDEVVRPFMDHRELYIFGTESIEPYQNTGNSDFPFERLPGRFVQHGLKAGNSVAQFAESIVFFADDYTIRMFIGINPETISPEPLNELLKSEPNPSEAVAYSYKDKGTWFYILTFPEGHTWALSAKRGVDESTNKSLSWHQLSSGLNNERHRSNCYEFFGGKHLVGDYENGKTYELSDTTYTDDGSAILRKRVSPVLFDPKDNFELTYNDLELVFKSGVGLASGQGSDAEIMMRYSDNGTRTWSTIRTESIGKLGKYTNRCRFQMLGSSRMRNYEVTMTDPIEFVLVGAKSNITKNRY